MSSEYGELINIDQLHYAKVSTDTISAYSTGSVSYLAPAGEIQHEAKTDANIRYYDGVPMFVTITEGATNVKVTVSGVPMSLASELTGKPYDDAHGIFIDTGDASNTPDYAFSGRMELGDGGYRYFQYLKGKFAIGTQSAQTRKDKTTEKTVDLTYTALTTNYQFNMPDGTMKGIKGLFADTTDAAFTPALQSGWFTRTQTPNSLGAVAALVLSSVVPADEATAVAVSAPVVLTFSNAIASENVTLISALGELVSVTKTYDSTGTVLTVKPTANLTKGVTYIVIVAGVTDIFGQSLPYFAINFTTAP